MAKLTSQQRKNLNSSQFAVPEKRAYPINDAAHARNALARASQFASPAVQAKIKSKVKKKFPKIAQKGSK